MAEEAKDLAGESFESARGMRSSDANSRRKYYSCYYSNYEPPSPSGPVAWVTRVISPVPVHVVEFGRIVPFVMTIFHFAAVRYGESDVQVVR